MNRLSNADIQMIGQLFANNHGIWVVSKVVIISVDQFLAEIARLQLQGRVNSKKIDRCVFKTGACADCSAENRRASKPRWKTDGSRA